LDCGYGIRAAATALPTGAPPRARFGRFELYSRRRQLQLTVMCNSKSIARALSATLIPQPAPVAWPALFLLLVSFSLSSRPSLRQRAASWWRRPFVLHSLILSRAHLTRCCRSVGLIVVGLIVRLSPKPKGCWNSSPGPSAVPDKVASSNLPGRQSLGWPASGARDEATRPLLLPEPVSIGLRQVTVG
jgi:hypothetical protein